MSCFRGTHPGGAPHRTPSEISDPRTVFPPRGCSRFAAVGSRQKRERNAQLNARTGTVPARAERDYFGAEESLAGGDAGGEAAGVDVEALLFFEWCVDVV